MAMREPANGAAGGTASDAAICGDLANLTAGEFLERYPQERPLAALHYDDLTEETPEGSDERERG